MNKKILIFSPFNLPANFLGLNFEFLQRGIDEGSEVYFISCHKTFKSCGFNSYGLKYMCEVCVKRFEVNKSKVSGDFNFLTIKDIVDDSDIQFAHENVLPKQALEKDYVVDGFEVGEAIHSSFISKTRKREFTTPEEIGILKDSVQQSLITYHALRRFMRTKGIDRLIVFNSRWDYYRAALSA